MHRKLGKTDINVSFIGLGTVKFGRNTGVKYPNTFNLPTDNEIIYLLQNAKEMGINFLDTAPAYGQSETRLGQCLKKIGKRSDWVISTKCGENYIDNISSFDFSKKATIKSVDSSLKRLQTDYLDMVLVHSNGQDVEIIQNDEVFGTLEELKKIGKIRAFGMSSKTIEGGKMAVEKSDVVMVTYNPIDANEKSVIDYAYQMNKGVLIKKSLASGHVEKISQNENPVKKSIEFILKEPGIHTIVIGTLNSVHLKEVIDFANLYNK